MVLSRIYKIKTKKISRVRKPNVYLGCEAIFISIKIWDEITYPLQNFNGCIVEIGGWISNFILVYWACAHFSMLGGKSNHVSKMVPCCFLQASQTRRILALSSCGSCHCSTIVSETRNCIAHSHYLAGIYLLTTDNKHPICPFRGQGMGNRLMTPSVTAILAGIWRVEHNIASKWSAIYCKYIRWYECVKVVRSSTNLKIFVFDFNTLTMVRHMC